MFALNVERNLGPDDLAVNDPLDTPPRRQRRDDEQASSAGCVWRGRTNDRGSWSSIGDLDPQHVAQLQADDIRRASVEDCVGGEFGSDVQGPVPTSCREVLEVAGDHLAHEADARGCRSEPS
jgi:hypothetical protein